MKTHARGDPLAAVPADLLPLIPGFLRRRGAEAETLLSLLAQADYGGIGEIAHKMKGNGGGFGLNYISELGARLELAAQARHPEEVRSVVQALSRYVSDLLERMHDSV